MRQFETDDDVDYRRFGTLLLFGLVTLLLWRTPLLLPLKILVVFLHETWHAVAALATGGTVEEIRVWHDQSGVTLFRGGNYVIAASAGYVGSALTGAALLWASARPRFAPWVLGGLGGLVVLMTLLYVPYANLFGFSFGLVTGGFLLLVASKRADALVLAVMGLAVMCCLYSIYDFADYLLGDPHRTDAGLLAQHLGAPVLAYPIGIVWSLVSLWDK